MGLNTVGMIVAGGIFGLGLIFVFKWMIGQMAADKLKAASSENVLKSKVETDAVVAEAKQKVEDIDNAASNRPYDPTDI